MIYGWYIYIYMDDLWIIYGWFMDDIWIWYIYIYGWFMDYLWMIYGWYMDMIYIYILIYMHGWFMDVHPPKSLNIWDLQMVCSLFWCPKLFVDVHVDSETRRCLGRFPSGDSGPVLVDWNHGFGSWTAKCRELLSYRKTNTLESWLSVSGNIANFIRRLIPRHNVHFATPGVQIFPNDQTLRILRINTSKWSVAILLFESRLISSLASNPNFRQQSLVFHTFLWNYIS